MNPKKDQLRILFDAAWLAAGPPSGKTVLRGVIGGWCESFPHDSITIRVPRGTSPEGLTSFARGIAIEESRHNFSNHGLSVLSTRPKRNRYDAYISQNFGTFFGDAIKCAFLHDGIYKDHPEWFSRLERLYLGAIRPSLRGADIVFTSSHAEAQRIVRLWPGLENKVRPVGLALPGWVHGPSSRPQDAPRSDRPYILTVGRLNVRKNLERLIAAYGGSQARDTHDLVIVGEPDGIATVPSEHAGVHFMTRISDSELKHVYQNASSFVFPSLDEGFGLPLIEAAYFHLPIAASNIPVFLEVALADLYFDPMSISDIRNSIDKLVKVASQSNIQFRGNSDWGSVAGLMRSEVLIRASLRRASLAG